MTAAAGIEAAAWPAARLGEALVGIAQMLAPERRPPRPPPAPDDLGSGPPGGAELGRWIAAAGRFAGLDVSPLDARATGVSELLVGGAPVVMAIPEAPAGGNGAAPVGVPVGAPGRRRFLVLLRTRARRGERTVAVLGPDHQVAWWPEEVVRLRLHGESAAERAIGAAVERFCATVGVAPGAQDQVAAVLRADRRFAGAVEGWAFHRAEPRFWARVRAAGGRGLAARALAGFVAMLVLSVGSWVVIGRGALDGRLEPGWLAAWMLMLVTMVACGSAASWATGKLAVQVGALTRERLLDGILRLSPEEVRSRGVGQLLGSVLEVEALEALARGGGPVAFGAALQVLCGAVVLALGASPWLHLGLLLLWLAATVVLGGRYYRRLLAWADARLTLSHELIETMVGYRTLVAQARREAERGEEGGLGAYERRGAALDAAAARLMALAPRGWLLVGLCGLAPGFVSGAALPDALAVSVGGVLLVYWALRRLAATGPALAAAAVAWQHLRPFFRAAAEAEAPAPPPVAFTAASAADAERPLLVARDVTFRYPSRPDPVLRGCTFSVATGDRILLQGPSGAGKSTLGSLLSGLRAPSSGVLLLGGFDHHSLGAGRWRERSGGVPQFHENHVLSAPLVFNLAMGRRWPPTQEDWREIQAISRELGLEALLERMPAGLQQMVGDSGWQLSHGERGRVFIARSLLQELDLRVLDESFAALDPETFEQVLDCVLRRTRTLVVVAHT